MNARARRERALLRYRRRYGRLIGPVVLAQLDGGNFAGGYHFAEVYDGTMTVDEAVELALRRLPVLDPLPPRPGWLH